MDIRCYVPKNSWRSLSQEDLAKKSGLVLVILWAHCLSRLKPRYRITVAFGESISTKDVRGHLLILGVHQYKFILLCAQIPGIFFTTYVIACFINVMVLLNRISINELVAVRGLPKQASHLKHSTGLSLWDLWIHITPVARLIEVVNYFFFSRDWKDLLWSGLLSVRASPDQGTDLL